jgi:hypothetical protein
VCTCFNHRVEAPLAPRPGDSARQPDPCYARPRRRPLAGPRASTCAPRPDRTPEVPIQRFIYNPLYYSYIFLSKHPGRWRVFRHWRRPRSGAPSSTHIEIEICHCLRNGPVAQQLRRRSGARRRPHAAAPPTAGAARPPPPVLRRNRRRRRSSSSSHRRRPRRARPRTACACASCTRRSPRTRATSQGPAPRRACRCTSLAPSVSKSMTSTSSVRGSTIGSTVGGAARGCAVAEGAPGHSILLLRRRVR